MNTKPKLYLSGPIEYTKDAYTWRETMDHHLGHKYNVIVPDQKKLPYTKIDPEYGPWVKENYLIPDMDDVTVCKYFFVYIDHVYSSGTYGELSHAAHMNKDIVCFLDEGIIVPELPMWVIAALSGATYVESVEDAIRHYKGL